MNGKLNSISEEVIGCAYDVSNALGAGFLEVVYENALSIELDHQGIVHERQKPLEVYYRGHVAGRYLPDLLVEGELIVEIKAVNKLIGEHQAQLLNYLKATDLKLGLLMNFGNPRVEIKRMMN